MSSAALTAQMACACQRRRARRALQCRSAAFPPPRVDEGQQAMTTTHVPLTQSELSAALASEFDVEHAVIFSEGVPGMEKATLCNPSGSLLDVYLRGATATSWMLPNGSDVLYVRTDTEMEQFYPISGGVTLCWPRLGAGGVEAESAEQGFAHCLEWEGVVEETLSPFIRLRLRDSPESRTDLDAAFELEYELTLGAKQLALRLCVRNTGDAPLEFSTGLLAHIGVADVREDKVMLLGLQGLKGLDRFRPGTPPGEMTALVQRVRGPVDVVALESQRVALEVGTGCTVFVENTAGFVDHAVWNPWMSNELYGNFVCLGSACAGSISLAPGGEWVGESTLFVRDVLLSATIPTEQLFEPEEECEEEAEGEKRGCTEGEEGGEQEQESTQK